MNFDRAVAIMIDKIEGGAKIVDDPNDRGGLTKYGISLRAYPELGRTGIRNLTREKAIAIYKADYWDLSKAESMPAGLRLVVFDSAVNQGITASAIILQRTLNTFRTRGKLELDGVIGPLTRAAISKANPFELTVAYYRHRRLAYEALNDEHNGTGWENRLWRISLFNNEVGYFA